MLTEGHLTPLVPYRFIPRVPIGLGVKRAGENCKRWAVRSARAEEWGGWGGFLFFSFFFLFCDTRPTPSRKLSIGRSAHHTRFAHIPGHRLGWMGSRQQGGMGRNMQSSNRRYTWAASHVQSLASLQPRGGSRTEGVPGVWAAVGGGGGGRFCEAVKVSRGFFWCWNYLTAA